MNNVDHIDARIGASTSYSVDPEEYMIGTTVELTLGKAVWENLAKIDEPTAAAFFYQHFYMLLRQFGYSIGTIKRMHRSAEAMNIRHLLEAANAVRVKPALPSDSAGVLAVGSSGVANSNMDQRSPELRKDALALGGGV